jgi:STE24 endopeptidase
MSPEQQERSDAYFEGGYWLQLWGFLYGLGVAALLLGSGLSARLRDLARRLTRRKPLETALYWLFYLPIVSLLGFPLTLYSGYFREHRYGLSTQGFGSWLGDQGKDFALTLVMGALFLPLLYGVFRKRPKSWPLWGGAGGFFFIMFIALIGPVFINPIFNEYKPLADEKVKAPILALARANGIPVTEVYEMDASRQTTRVSANVSGFLGTERITLNDNLLNRSSLPEIEAVMAHEMGHYVLNHVYEMVLEFGLVIAAGFAFLRYGMAWALARWGARFRLEGVGDVASLPLLGAVFAVFFFVVTPVTNTIIRVNEVEADIFGLNAAGEPDGFAEAALKLGEYRKMSPGPLEEFLFFDHPSGRNRILMSMRWKAEHLAAAAPPASATP